MACTRYLVPAANKMLQYQNLKGNTVDSCGTPLFQQPFMQLKCPYPSKIRSFIRSGLMQIAYTISLLYYGTGNPLHTRGVSNLFKKLQLVIGFAYLNQTHYCALDMALSENLCCFLETFLEKSILFLCYKGLFFYYSSHFHYY